MNELLEKKTINTSKLTPIEIALGIDENGMTTAKKLYEFLEMDKSQYSRWCKNNITGNEFAEEGKDYEVFDLHDENPQGGRPTQDFKLTSNFARKLSMTQKNEKGEQARDYFAKVDDGAKEMSMRIQDMSPELRLLINMEMEQKRQAKDISDVKENQKVISQALGKEIEEDFRSWVNHSLSAIAESQNYQYIGSQQERHQAVRAESYERLNSKRPCNLKQRVNFAKGRAVEAGASQTKVRAINNLTIIEDDKDLKPVYESVIREMLVAYCVEIKQI